MAYDSNSYLAQFLRNNPQPKPERYASGGQDSGSESAYDPESASYNPYALGNRGFFIPSLASLQGGGGGGGGVATTPMGGGGGTTQIDPITGMPTAYGMGTAGQFTGQDPRYFSAYAGPEALAESRRKAAQGMMSQYGLDKPQTFIQPLLKEAATQNVQTMKDWENMARDIESRYAGGGASLSSERNRALEEGRGATMMATRSARTKAETAGMGQWANVMAQLLSIMGR